MSNFFLNKMADQLRTLQNEGQGMRLNFEEKFSQINDEEAFICAQPGIHSVAQIVKHATDKKLQALACLEKGVPSKAENEPEEWADNEELRKKGWPQVKKDFEDAQLALSNKFVTLNNIAHNQAYSDKDYEKEYNLSFTLQGILQHDHYHLGQLTMVIRMIKKR